MRRRRHVFICAPGMPEFDRESGSRRVFDFIGYFREAGWAVSFAAQFAPEGQRYARLLQQQGVAVYTGFDARLEQMIGSAPIDLALLAFWGVAESILPVVRRLAPGVPIIVDSIDVHFLRLARGTFQDAGAGHIKLLDAKFGDEMRRELNVYAAADSVLTVSQKEADLINDLTADPSLAIAVPDAEELTASTIPLEDRRGIVFVGNFRHAPNVGAVEFLCHDILPRVDRRLLHSHPVSIVGNAPNDAVRRAVSNLPGVRLVGWVPSVVPYLQHSRVAVIPLRYGAGTKRKLIQSLMVGTPTVSTSIGVEGLQLQDDKHVLIADQPEAFAEHIERLLAEADTWQRLAMHGRSHVLQLHGRRAAQARWAAAIATTLERTPKPAPVDLRSAGSSGFGETYATLVQRIAATARDCLPEGSSTLVVSKGDQQLVTLDGRRAGHFPQTSDGVYAGQYPASSSEAIAQLQTLQVKGFGYLLFPATAYWWLDHYKELTAYLAKHAAQVHGDGDCRIFRLASMPTVTDSLRAPHGKPSKELVVGSGGVDGASANGHEKQQVDQEFIEQVRPRIHESVLLRRRSSGDGGRRVLVFGVYLANQPNTADHIVGALSASQHHCVDQRWVALLGDADTQRVDEVTVCSIRRKTPKFQILNELMADIDLTAYDYVLLTDDDVVLPDGFLDRYIDLQEELGFVIAQPARTSNSYIDHPIVEQQKGVMARRTMFVEIGPVVSFHHSIYDLVFPFDMTSPMGWGYENVWSRRLAKRGLKMGIIDALPVDHSLRKPVANYVWAEANEQRKQLLAAHEHYTLDQCFRVLEVIPYPQNTPEPTGELSFA